MDNTCRVVLHRFDLNGKPLWKSPTVVSSVTYSRIASTFASDGHGGLILVWQPYENFTHDNIYAPRIDATGKTLWGANGITVCDALSKEDEIAIVGDGNGGVVVAWKDDRDIFPDIYAQRIGADGNMVPHLLVVAGEAGDVNIVFSDQADIYLYRIR